MSKPMKFHNGSIITSEFKLPSGYHRQFRIIIVSPNATRALGFLREKVKFLNMSAHHFNGYFSRNMSRPPTSLLKQESVTPERLIKLFADEEIWVESREGYVRIDTVLKKQNSPSATAEGSCKPERPGSHSEGNHPDPTEIQLTSPEA